MYGRSLVTEPRFPCVSLDRGHYESFYAKLSSPDEPVGLWIRYTVHKASGGLPRGSVWVTLFDRDRRAPIAVKYTFTAAETRSGGQEYARFGRCRFDANGLVGQIEAGEHTARWDLRIESGGEPFHHLPRRWMYRSPVPRTKLLSPHPAARFTGSAEIDGRRVKVESWPGMVGHNWGAEHAERWIWMHGTSFEGHDPATTWLDIAVGRIKLGPWRTPWIANGVLAIEGRRHRLGGPEKARQTKISESPAACEFTMPGDGVNVEGVVGAPPDAFVGWVYADPDGSEHNVVNCSVSKMSLVVARDGRPDLALETASGAAFELGMRETDHGVPIQPFSDG